MQIRNHSNAICSGSEQTRSSVQPKDHLPDAWTKTHTHPFSRASIHVRSFVQDYETNDTNGRQALKNDARAENNPAKSNKIIPRSVGVFLNDTIWLATRWPPPLMMRATGMERGFAEGQSGVFTFRFECFERSFQNRPPRYTTRPPMPLHQCTSFENPAMQPKWSAATSRTLQKDLGCPRGSRRCYENIAKIWSEDSYGRMLSRTKESTSSGERCPG